MKIILIALGIAVIFWIIYIVIHIIDKQAREKYIKMKKREKKEDKRVSPPDF